MFSIIKIVTLLIVFVPVIIILATFIWGGFSAAPWLPVKKRDVRRMLKLAAIKPGDNLYDLGSGDGRLIINSTLIYKANSTGFEIAVLPYLVSWIKIRLLGLNSKTKVKYKNFYRENLSQADVITAFLTPRAMKKLRLKFDQELKPGCRVVSYAFSVPGWNSAVVDKPTEDSLRIFLYKV